MHHQPFIQKKFFWFARLVMLLLLPSGLGLKTSSAQDSLSEPSSLSSEDSALPPLLSNTEQPSQNSVVTQDLSDDEPVELSDGEGIPFEAKTAWLYVLDKTTAKSQTIEAPIGKVIRVGPLRINVCQCYKNDPESSPESRAYLDIWYAQEGEPTEHIFSGWMFASSPSVSALEHPSYDVWVKDCQ